MISVIKGIKIAGVASAVPNNWISLKEQCASNGMVDEKSIQKFIKNTGVTGRYLSNERQTASDLCCVAAEKIIQEKKIDRKRIGLLVFVTQTGDYQTPASAMVLHYRLGLSESCLAFDVNLGCSGFTCGIEIVSSILSKSDKEYALLCCGDTSARLFHPNEEFKDRMLFGDCGSVALLEKEENAKEIHMISKTDGSNYKYIINPYGWFRNQKYGQKNVCMMDGINVYNFSISKAPEIINELMEVTNTNPQDYDCLVLHQANKLIIDQIANKTNFGDNKNLVSISTYGNTSSASIPTTLVYSYGDNKEDKDLHCLMCGFGIGLSWSAVECYINTIDILPQIYSDDYFEDGYHID